ncbi:hypothetical protein CCR75_000815 [Bremia lactucae]|uniref:FYVE-type domain-containing protein n=1 Tax=Bremia lactucae TaxID=4779 RepID=A0A976IC03_BRELC|nr:hypothetical protein CCR75_000815 [Bremia lactucae]
MPHQTPNGNPRVHVNDNELRRRAEVEAHAIDFKSLSTATAFNNSWIPQRTSRGTFTTFTRQFDATRGIRRRHLSRQTHLIHQVLVTGTIRCHFQELVHFLRTTTECGHNTVMRNLYRNDFIHGSVVHVLPSTNGHKQTNPIELVPRHDTQVAVKTSVFLHSKRFALNEQWCFLERAHVTTPDPTKKCHQSRSFTLTCSSMDDTELQGGKVKAYARVKLLHHLTIGFHFHEQRDPKCIRVTFFAQFHPQDVPNKTRFAQASQMRARVMRLAKGVTHLQESIRRRRFQAQPLATPNTFLAMNTHCTCCIKSLRVLTRKHQCHVCGHFVCTRCWSIHEIESKEAYGLTPVRVCLRCMERVDKSTVKTNQSTSLSRPRIQNECIDSTPSTEKLVHLLQKEFRSSSGTRKHSVRTVIQYLVTQEVEEQRKPVERRLIRLTSASTENELSTSVHHRFQIPYVPFHNGSLANATQDAPELNMLCKLAASQLNCSVSIVTTVYADKMLLLASNIQDLQCTCLPRQQTLCQHSIVTTKPVIVPHFEETMRFYCGFPILDRHNTVLGSLCCMDPKPQEVTQAQYIAMTKLAAATAGFVQSATTSRQRTITP